MSNKYVYLAGPISGVDHGEATDWRSRVSTRLLGSGIGLVTPMRGKGLDRKSVV